MRQIKYSLLLALLMFYYSSYAIQRDNPQVDSIINSFMNKRALPGGSFTMAYNQTIIYSKDYMKFMNIYLNHTIR